MVQLLQQLVAAVLNIEGFGMDGDGLIRFRTGSIPESPPGFVQPLYSWVARICWVSVASEVSPLLR
jgi:hypothetical protein